MRKLIAIAAAAALFALPAYAAPVYVPSQAGAVGPNVACTTQDGASIRCIQPSVTLNDATGAAIGTSGNPLVTSPGTGTTGDINVKQVNGATVNVGVGAAGTGTARVTTSTDSTIGTVTSVTTVGAVTAITNALPAGTNALGSITPQVAAFTDKSGTIATGGTSQQLAAANASRKRIIIENPCSSTTQGIATAESLFINWTTAASGSAGSSVELTACGSYDSQGGPVSGEQINVVAATINHKYIAKEQ